MLACKKIAIIGKNTTIYHLVKNILEKENYQVISFHSPDAFLKNFSLESDLTLVLLNLTPKDTNSFKTCTAIREISKIPIMFLISKSSHTMFKQAFESGGNDFIQKPFQDIELCIRVNNLITSFENQKKKDTLVKQINHDLDFASKVQKVTLPKPIYVDQSLSFNSAYLPSSKLGGDLFDFVPIEKDKYFFYIGDVSGHGVASSLVMMSVKAFLNTLIQRIKHLSPFDIAQRLNNFFHANFTNLNFMTFLNGFIDLNLMELRFFNSGHPAIIQKDTQSQSAHFIKNKKGAFPLGWLGKYNFRENETTIKIHKGKQYIFYTDGLFEHEGEDGHQFGLNGLLNLVSKHQQQNDDLFYSNIICKSILEKSNSIQKDDFSIFSINVFTDLDHRLKLALNLKFDDLHIVRQNILSYLANKNVKSKTINQIGLLTHEFLVNILKDGYQINEKNRGFRFGFVYLIIDVQEKITIDFIDNGIEWTLEGNMNEVSKHDESGRGLHIIHQLVSNVRLERVFDFNRFTVRLTIDEN